MAFDRHMNLVLGDAEEFRRIPARKGQEEVRLQHFDLAVPCHALLLQWRCGSAHVMLQKEERRVLGLLLLRGEEVVSITIEGPPPADHVRAEGPGLVSSSSGSSNRENVPK
jgi:small nuclear ribonucleoprotein B and B'